MTAMTLMTSMNSIPDKVLGKILALCPPEELSKLEQVSPRWSKVVGKHCGIVMVKGNQLESYETLRPKSSLSRMDLSSAYAECISAISSHKLLRRSKESLANGDHVSAQDLTQAQPAEGDPAPKSPAELTAMTVQPKLVEDSPENIRKLCLIGTISLPEISILINGCRNLRALHIHISTLATIPRNTKNLVMDIPTLKTLFIDSFVVKELYKKMEGSLATLDFKFGIGVAAMILETNYFPHLETLLVDLPYAEPVEKRVIKAVSVFLSKHHDSLKSLGLHQTFLLNVPDDEEDGSEEDDDDDSSESSEYTVSLRTLAVCANQLKNVTLEEINIRLACQQDSAPLWKNFILFQTGLRKLIYVGNSRIPFPSRTIQENGASLGTLILETRDSIDLAPLQSCKVLKKLTLLTHPNQQDEDDEMDVCSPPTAPSMVRNAHLLPPSLESVAFRHLLVKRSDVEAIVSLQNLRKLEFYSCGNETDFGVPIQVIGRIFGEKKLQKFSIKYSLNRKSLTDKPLSPDVALVALAIKNNCSITGFEIQGTLSPSGEEYLSSRSSWEETADKVVAGTDAFEFPDETIPYGGTFVETFGIVEEEPDTADPEDDDDETMGTETEDETETTTDGYGTNGSDVDEIDVDDEDDNDGEDMDQNQ